MTWKYVYGMGDVIRYRPVNGGIRTVVVKAHWYRIGPGHGKPGFDGHVLGEQPKFNVWGYDDQITEVVSSREVA
jgi:hypothetical protein